MIGIQILDRLEFIHNKNIIHRDIKPDNFVTGLENKSHIIYVLDFGLSKKFRSSRTHQHIKFTVNKKLTGTARYASINALKGCEQSRRDDLEAIGYVLMYFLRGSLPWQGLQIQKGEDRYKKILQKKKATTAEELCKGFPKEFVDYINYTRNLEFEADPDYKYLRNLLVTVLEKENSKFDFWYDWVTEKPTITDEIAIGRYINNNTNISFELKSDDKKDKEGVSKGKENENENMTLSKYNTMQTNQTNNEVNNSRHSTEIKQNISGINISSDGNNATNQSAGKADTSEDKKNNKKNKDSKKKDKKDKDKDKDKDKSKCSIW